ncbi:MAG: TonB-dependent receptor domain-containing protein [Bacteroidales bacterium]
MKKLIPILTLIITNHINTLFSQNGIIRGTVYDYSLAEPMMSVTVVVDGTGKGTMTDLDGNFNISVPAGTYTLKLSFVSYETIIINEVKVEAGKVTLFENIRMKEASLSLSEVVVTADMTRNTEIALLDTKMKSPNVIDGISALNFKKIGDSDAASSMKRITGVSVEGGKYVYIRGLGDRYTKTIINGVDIPGLDPDRNTMQMDLFPTTVIDNIMVYKSFTAELPADFTGGVIDISTKDFPEKKKINISWSASYNPDFHFRKDFLDYKGGSYDFLGFDDGTRRIPATTNIPFFASVISNPEGDEGLRYREILAGFNPNMAAIKQTSLMDFGFGITAGNQLSLKKITLGYNFGVSYKNNTEFYENAEYGRYGLSADHDINDLEVREFQIGNFGVKSVLVSGMAGFSLKTQKSKYRINLLHLQNGESKAGIFDYEGSDKGSNFKGFQHNLEYNQRSLTNILIDGRKNFNAQKINIVWKISPTISIISDPDTRFLRYVTEGQSLRINTEGGFPERIWRNLSEFSFAGILHISKEFSLNGNNSRMTIGGGYTYKEREFVIRKFAFNIRNLPLTGNPDEIFFPENLWPLNGAETTRGTTYEANFIPTNSNQFDAKSSNMAGYISTELGLTKSLKTIAGLRFEHFTQRYTGQDQMGINILNNDKVLDNINLFPSLNLIYNLKTNQNLRFSFARTIARPSFKEMSYAEISDPVSGRTFIGGMFRDANNNLGIEYWDGNLRSSYITNIDLRWEIFMKNGQMISLSTYYKDFKDPIEVVQFATQTGSFQPRNVADGSVFGTELELRQNFGFLSKSLSNFSISGNISFTKSQIELGSTEFLSRVENARNGQIVNKYRIMAGQAPYIINAGLTYNGNNKKGFLNGFEAAFYYNVQGMTLQYVGIADLPDIYSLPFHSLNFNVNKSFGKDKKTQIGIKIENLLNDKKESVFKSFNVTDPFFTKLEPGITFQFRFSYSIF